MDYHLCIALLSYVAKHPRQTLALLRQLYFDSRTRFHQQRIAEYQKYQRSLTEALTFVATTSKNTLTTLSLAGLPQDLRYGVSPLIDSNYIPSEWDADPTLAYMVYYICHLLQPKAVVETGVAHGITSAFILQALAENGRGHLYSIDLPAFKRGSEKFVGIAVPERLKNRWTLTLDLSSHALPRLLPRLGEIDLFLHDSDHSYHNQLMEYNLGWRYLSQGGVLLSDDVNSSNAFIEFAETHRVQAVSVPQSAKEQLIGLAIKP